MLFNEPFGAPGVVSPREYDWRKQFVGLAKGLRKGRFEPFALLDVGKVLGLAQYAHDLEEENRRLRG